MPRPIAYNILRTIFEAANGVPRGVDRIDFGWLSHLFEHWPGDCVGVLPTPWGTRFFARERVLRGRDCLARLWRETDRDGDDPAMALLRAACATPGAASSRPPPKRSGGTDPVEYLRVLRLFLAAGPSLGRPIDRLPAGTIYVDVAQRGLIRPEALDWLDRRPDVAPVFLIHDVIPIEFPELGSVKQTANHVRILDTTARRAAAVLTTTASAAAGIASELARRGRPDLPVHVRALPIDDVFRAPPPPDPVIAARPYFLACGAVALRKNLPVLVEAWARMIAARGGAVPRLVIAGSTDSDYADALRADVAGRGLGEHVVFASGLATPSIARLMAGARAVLMPSLTEGFGLPPVEAMAMGVPAIVSDIPAHRDAAGPTAHYVAPRDVDGWIAAVEAFADDTPVRAAALDRLRGHRSLDWPTYMAGIADLLAAIP
jgi:glycosyltransferase involved in cell wall biosynthesis